MHRQALQILSQLNRLGKELKVDIYIPWEKHQQIVMNEKGLIKSRNYNVIPEHITHIHANYVF